MSNVNAQSQVTLSAGSSVISGAPAVEKTIALDPSLPPVLRACLFAGPQHGAQHPADAATIDHKAFAANCVVPYINGLWLDPKALLRTHESIAEQARDELITHPAGEPFPIFYPPQLGEPVLARLRDPLSRAADVTVRPLPAELPAPTLSKDSLYNNIGLLFLPNAYVVPGGTFNEMYGWDSFFIVKGMLASVDYIMAHPTARIWSPSREAFIQLDTKPGSDTYYRAYANRLFQVAKGMVDNHIFQIAYYGGFILNANRTYYLNRSQPPLFTQAALAVFESALRYGFAYEETLAPYFAITQHGFVAPRSWTGWLAAEVLPAARTYYAYWTDPATAKLGSAQNPRVAPVTHEGKQHHVYLYGTDGVGPAPEVARSTQPQNRLLYADVAKYFAGSPDRDPDQRFFNPGNVCTGPVLANGCGDPVYKLTEAFYRADRAVRASGYDLSGRFGTFGEWTMNYAPISLNVLLLQMAADMDRIATLVGGSEPFGAAALAERRAFLRAFFAHPSAGYADRFVGLRPANVPEFAYPYGTQFYLLWGGVLEGTDTARAFVEAAGTFLSSGKEGGRYGIPTSFMGTGMQWDLPYAWAPIQFFAADGLAANGYYADASRVMLNWIAAVNLFFAHTGIIIEKYDSVDPAADPRVRIGYSHAQHGFGWSNAAYMLFVNRLYGRM